MQHLSLEEYLKEEALEEYYGLHHKIEQYFIMCQHYLFFLRRIQEFDGKLFGIYDDGSFWSLTKFTYVEMFLIRFYSLTFDKNKKSLTLSYFLNFLQDNARTIALQNHFLSTFGKENFDEWLKTTRLEIERLRHKLTAHLDVATVIQEDIEYPSTTRLFEIFDQAVTFFQSMSFTFEGDFWLWGYDANKRTRRTTDIDELLQLIAINSPIIERSQDHPEIWDIHRRDLTDSQIAKINEIRRKMGLPDVE